MKHRCHRLCPQNVRMAAIVIALVALVPLVAACGGEIIMVTATPEAPQVVVVVTATFTPAPPADTVVPPTADMPATVQAALAATLAAVPTNTPVPPTDTPVPPTADVPATVQAALAATQAAAPTNPPAPPTSTAVPPANTAAPAKTAAPKPTSAPKASLSSYGVIYGHFDGGNQADENKYSVWVVRGDGSQASKIVDKGFEPAYSPNGHKFAYFHCWTGIRVYNLDNKTEIEVAPDGYAEFGSFSPDGGRLVYHKWAGNWWSMDVNLYIVNADGSGTTKLPIQGMRPAWSPKGDLISYDSCTGSACGIYVVQPDGGGARQLTTDGGGKANWAPDGKKLVYGADSGGNPEIFVVNLDGSGRKQLTHNSGNDTLPVYSPDGQWIFWLGDQSGTGWAILAMRPDGSDIRKIRSVGVPERWQFSRLWVGWW